ncbi:site-specific recombinase [Aquabacterium sp. OR-4]|uniref:site-specific recombinase n=1 Tax=Aquabacterium sp. OR-4 TaxID=2978127 RepID=UPI0021B36DEB|nr:site-specific recombinase [Aquabacterium sp. OR-4]MDT7837724.1 site-specific recombinase [Aquabacterium sp. OR-4]
MTAAAWDLTALVNAADPGAARPERHLWLIRLTEWLRHGRDERGADGDATPRPVLRLKHLLNMLERNAGPRERVLALLGRLWRESDVASLFADFGFTARRDLGGEVAERLRLRLLPGTPDTDDLAALFALLFPHPDDARWLAAIDAATLARLAALFSAARADAAGNSPAERPPEATAAAAAADWRAPLLQAITWLVSSIRAAAFAPALRQRVAPALVADRPFEQLVRCAEDLDEALAAGRADAVAQQANYLRALLQRCRSAADSVHEHLEAHGISVNILFELDQLRERTLRLEALLDVLLAPAPAPALQRLLVDLVTLAQQRRSLRALLGRQYSLLARKVAERHAETGEHYITRTAAEYRAMLRAALGGGAVIAGTTFAKFALLALGLAPFWGGVAAGLNYAVSFVIVHLLHWTVATKQPAMTAPTMADKLAAVKGDGQDAAAIESFVDEVTHLVRSQIAGIAGNLAAVTPLVLLAQWLAWQAFGAPLVGAKDAQYVLHSITLLGPTALYAAFTGVLLFGSSLAAGWVENWFVYHRLDSALAWHPAMVARLGGPRAARWAGWWRANISGMAANVSLGLMLGVVPVVLAFVGLPIEVRHVTLSTGQLAAAASTLGWATLQQPAFWWCVAGLAATGVLNLGVSFALALAVALRSRGIGGLDRRRIVGAILRRLRQAPRSFVLPARTAG